jgi:paired amphipathic helix protein Sin3a
MRVNIAYILLTYSAIARSQLIAFPVERIVQQLPLMDPVGPALPPTDPAEPPTDPRPPPSKGSVILSDVMGRDRSINIFAGFARDIESTARRLDDESRNTTVLAPLNSAIEALPRKPWEDPRDYGDLGSEAYEGEDGYERAQRNMRRFVEAHMVPTSPWREREKVKALGDDREIWWENKDGAKVVSRSAVSWSPSGLLTRADPAWKHQGSQRCEQGAQRRGGQYSASPV